MFALAVKLKSGANKLFFSQIQEPDYYNIDFY